MLWYNDVFDRRTFEELTSEGQRLFLWKRAYEILKEAARKTSNEALLEVCEYAYNKALARNLDTDYRMVTADVVLYGHSFTAAVWVNFHKNRMYPKLTIEKDVRIIFERQIDKTKPGFEFFFWKCIRR